MQKPETGGNQSLKKAQDAAQQYLSWFKNHALPFWLDKGVNPDTGASWEKLDPQGRPIRDSNYRLRVQARQIFVYSFAAQKGWISQERAHAFVTNANKFIEQYGQHAQSAGYVHLLDSKLAQVDQKQDLYDHAFHILANIWQAKAFGGSEKLKKAKQLIGHLDTQFTGELGGFLEGDYQIQYRRQNPHMHLFETFIAGAELFQDTSFAARAGEMYQLFSAFFYDRKFGVLREYFTDDWQVLPGNKGDIIEPGHMLEWSWLLLCYECLASKPLYQEARNLFETAISLGQTEQDLFYDEVDPAGEPIKHTKRSWAMTEYIKSSTRLYLHDHSLEDDRLFFADHIHRATHALMTFYIAPADASPSGRGAYIDQIGEDMKPASRDAQASTLYHYAVAAAELENFLEQTRPAHTSDS